MQAIRFQIAGKRSSNFGRNTLTSLPSSKSPSKCASMKEVYISVDIEAAGPIPAMYSMLSLGAALVHDLQTNFYTELRPINRKSVPAAMKVLGRTLKEFG